MEIPEFKLYNFDHALAIAGSVHAGQVDRGSEPYILHPIRVSLRLGSPMLRIVGLLHDTLEDCKDYELEFLKMEISNSFGSFVLSLVEQLTRREEQYERYISGIIPYPAACLVKLADLEDNLDQSRWERTGYTPAIEKRQRYLWARWYLQRALVYAEKQSMPPLGVCKTKDSQTAINAGNTTDRAQ